VDEESIKGIGRMFPILGGRLLKKTFWANEYRFLESFQSLEGGY